MSEVSLKEVIPIKLYSILATLFWLIRQVAIPNPFDVLGEGLTITIADAPILLSPEFLNLIADPIIAAFTFGIVGFHYISKFDPAWGSILYMFFYAVHIGLVYWIFSLYPVIWLMVTIGATYIGLHIAAVILRNKIEYGIWR